MTKMTDLIMSKATNRGTYGPWVELQTISKGRQ